MSLSGLTSEWLAERWPLHPVREGFEDPSARPPGFVAGEVLAKPGSKSLRAKKAEALHLNLKGMIARHGIERVAFVTLTFADNVCDFREAQARFNSLASNLLKGMFREWIVAVHRGEERGRLHYHLIVATPDDIRTGFNFDAWRALLAHVHLFGRKNPRYRELASPVYASANPALRNIWKTFRDRAKGYGFGIVETYPVRSNADAVGRYVGSYVKTGADRRQLRDRGMRTIRYSLKEDYTRIRDVVWPDGPALVWRNGEAALCLMLGVDGREGLRHFYGKRWAWHMRDAIMLLGRWSDRASEAFYRAAADIAVQTEFDRKWSVALFCDAFRKWEEKQPR